MYVNPKGKGKHNIISVGDCFTNNKGQKVVVKSMTSHKSIKVVFEDAGVETTYEAGQLRKAMFNHPNRYNSIIGDRYENKQGDWCTVVGYKSRDDVTIVFDGYEDKPKKVWKSDLKKRAFKNVYKPSVFGVGYMGEGAYSSGADHKKSQSYSVYTKVIKRCYDENIYEKQPTYRDCTICSEWLCYNTFAEYYETNLFYGLGYDLDKDLLVSGNKHYSAETCVMLPVEINRALAGNPVNETGYYGVTKKHNRYQSRCTIEGNERKYLGSFLTLEEASAAYVKAKEAYIKTLAEKWKGKIEDKAFIALMQWTVYPKDSL
jgi:hypothetical protein